MPIIKSHHKLIFEDTLNSANGYSSNDMNYIVSNITFDILKESPGLVADVAIGAIDRLVLETAIIKDIDRHKYHFGCFGKN